MPKRQEIRKVLLIGSGPIVIGQAAEFDYAGSQACRVLREEGVEIVLVNSNPATIMTDHQMADKIYIEPLTLPTIQRIIEKERPDSILSGLGGQTALTLCMQLAKSGYLEKMGVRLLGSLPETIDRAEDRQLFKETMEAIGQPVIPSVIATEVQTALEFAAENGYPVMIRPAFTLGGTGGGMAEDAASLRRLAAGGIAASPIGQILVERSVYGWKEIEFEVMRDSLGNAITVCSMENIDPVGIHTGDSVVVAPALTLADREYQMLRSAALDIVSALGVEGGCNCQFALDPDSFAYAVIEVNPRVSRSSALASKATGYPIAKVAAKIALGYTLDEIPNAVTGKTFAAFEPALDYVAVKFPKWPFDKFVYAERTLGTQMKATGEVMSISNDFADALRKAVRGIETGRQDLSVPAYQALTEEELLARLTHPTDERLFLIYEALRRGHSVEEMHGMTKIDPFFLYHLQEMTKEAPPVQAEPVFHMVDTCAGEFEAQTPYFYAAVGGRDEAADYVANSKKERVLVLGSGPIRIGQGIEFDYACVRCVTTLKEMGYDAIVVNNNPETVSTDFDISDRLYFEPLCIDDIMRVIAIEQPKGVITAFGGGTSVKLAKQLAQRGIPILGSSADTIDICEDRERFDEMLEELQLKRPKGSSVETVEEAVEAAKTIGFPVLLRPSYVLGGQNMTIAFREEDVREFAGIIFATTQDNPVLVDQYLGGLEIEVDALCDGKDVLIPGIMEHIERTGIHSGDSIAVYPPRHIDDALAEKIYQESRKLCLKLQVCGLVNIQYIVLQDELYLIEVNPRASRTVPYISKVTGIPMCDVATKLSMGETLERLGYHSGIYPAPPYVTVKVPVFSFAKLTDVDTQLGPEMKSTGEVLGIGKNFQEAIYKGLVAAGYTMKKDGNILITVRDQDKAEIAAIGKKFAQMGFSVYATAGTAYTLRQAGISVTVLPKISEDAAHNPMTVLRAGGFSYVISTSQQGRNPAEDDVKIRRQACTMGIPCLTSIDTANALADSLLSGYSQINTELVDINAMRKERLQLPFVKMQCAGNDYIYIDGMERSIGCPESLPPALADRHYGIGGDGVVLIEKSQQADAAMRIFNADGSEGKMAGNAVRCVAKYLYEKRGITKREMTIETKSGIKHLRLFTTQGLVSAVQVDMGKAEFAPQQIPVRLDGEAVIQRSVTVEGVPYAITCVSMGNPHAVVFCEDVEGLDVPGIGPGFEHHPLFPEGVNTEFVRVLDRHTLQMRVWERGNGETLSCGTGACAAVAAAVCNGYCDWDTTVKVIVRGGELRIRCSRDTVTLTGDCVMVFEGLVSL